MEPLPKTIHSPGKQREQARSRLAEAGEEFRAARDALERARLFRDEAIVDATDKGLSRREAAVAAGVTPGRIQQVLDKAEP